MGVQLINGVAPFQNKAGQLHRARRASNLPMPTQKLPDWTTEPACGRSVFSAACSRQPEERGRQGPRDQPHLQGHRSWRSPGAVEKAERNIILRSGKTEARWPDCLGFRPCCALRQPLVLVAPDSSKSYVGYVCYPHLADKTAGGFGGSVTRRSAIRTKCRQRLRRLRHVDE